MHETWSEEKKRNDNPANDRKPEERMKTTNIADFIKPEEFLAQAVQATTVKAVLSLLNQLPIVSEHDYTFDTLNPSKGWVDGKFHWIPLGKDRGNAGRIKLATHPENPIAERGINAMEALIELERRREIFKDSSVLPPQSPREAVMRYLRKRMVVVVDLDDLSPKAHAEIIQGSRSGFYEGQVYHKIRGRLIATLHSDPDLLDLEEEAAEELSQLQTGDAAVQQALDQLIEHHFDLGDHSAKGGDESGGKEGHFFGADGKPVNINVVTFGEDGTPALGPVLVSNHAAETLRLPPNTKSKLTVRVAPNSEWDRTTNIEAFVDPITTGLNCIFTKNNDNATVELEFVESSSFDQNDYPIEATLRILANFKDVAEPRLLEKTIAIRPRIKRPTPPPRKLTDTPTYIRIVSRQPVRLIAGGPDMHVKVLWDGNDHLTFEPNPAWTFSSSCTSHANFSVPTFTKPSNGRFEALIHTPEDTLVGTKLSFQLQAHGPNSQILSVDFVAEVEML